MTKADEKAIAYLRKLISSIEVGEATVKLLEVDAHVVDVELERGRVAQIPTGQHVMQVVYMRVPKPAEATN